jgi:Subtilisin inhibitor-like
VPPALRKLRPGPCTGAAVLVLAVLVLTGCSSGPGDDGASPASSSPARALEEELVVELDRGDGSEPERYTLTCTDPVTGDLPDAAAACAHLSAMTDPFARLPSDLICTEQFGGPQTARVTGRWAGADVDLRLSRVDGCRISQWDGLGPLLPGPVG